MTIRSSYVPLPSLADEAVGLRSDDNLAAAEDVGARILSAKSPDVLKIGEEFLRHRQVHRLRHPNADRRQIGQPIAEQAGGGRADQVRDRVVPPLHLLNHPLDAEVDGPLGSPGMGFPIGTEFLDQGVGIGRGACA